jgi:DNA-binding FadR family transcriptional regulator
MFYADILAWRFAAGVDRRFLGHLFALRQAFEPMAAAMMAERHDDEASGRLAALNTRLSEAGPDREAFARADLAFHLFILESAGNPFLQSIGALIRTALAASFEMSAPDAEAADAHILSSREHGALTEAIATGDSHAAAAAMMQVIRRGWTNLGGASQVQLAAIDLIEFVP